jgi:DNA-binding response OmpR family regulator
MEIATAEPMSDDKLRGVHVLLVEDTDDTRELLREALQYCGALVTTAASKKEAERLLRDLSDIAMPDDGIALLRDVMEMANKRGTKIPVIAISAERHHPVDLVRAGFVQFVLKPLDPIALCEQVRAHVRPAA